MKGILMNKMYGFLFKIGGISLMVGFLFPNLSEAQQQNTPPNILIILADDLGYGDLQCYNSKSLVPTPNLDRLAAEGIRLTDAYCPVSVCSPTRYSLMTGQYPWRSWKKSGVMANYEPSMIDSAQLTLPEMLQEAGYTTAGFGKWHLGATFPTTDGEKPVGYGKFRADDNGANLALDQPITDGPLDHGFEHWLGFSCASECWILEDNPVMGAIQHDLYTIEAARNTEHLKLIPLEDYLPFITEKTLNFLQQQATGQSNQPFFLYFAPYVPHIPLSVSKEFLGSTKAGEYGDYVHELDHYIGKILNTLDSLQLTENTIVLFASDNGSQFTATSNKMDLSNASNNPESNTESKQDDDVHHPNGRLRGTKWTAWEGGVRTPFIARWPGHFPSGAKSNQLFALTDIMATLAAVINYRLPENAAVDSYNLLPVLRGKDKNIREKVVIQSNKNALGLRSGKWKYIGAGDYQPENPGDPEGELYDLSEDASESVNLYLKYPKVAEKMKKELEGILNSKHSAVK